ncbi:MAG: endo-1,4-beta-xylanase [Bryobacteraceae bacterium]
MRRFLCLILFATSFLSAQTLRQAGAQRALLMGAAADASEQTPDPLATEPLYASTLGTQYSMLEPENAMKWAAIHPAQSTYNFAPGDELVAFAEAHQMHIRGHNLCWDVYNPAWVNTLAATATPATMSAVLQDHINTVMTHYKGQVFAWDVVNEAVSDSQTGTGTVMKDSIWYNQPGIGLTGTGYVEQALQWAHAADPNALLFYNDYNIEDSGAKFNAVYAMVKDFVTRGVPINGVGIQMHLDTTGYPSSAGLTQNIQMLTALGLQVHITEMDVKIPVDSNGVATAAYLQAQAATYQRILTICLQNPGCTAFQTWGFTDAHSWIPSSYPGFGDALPFDVNYQPKPAFNSIIAALQTVPPVLNSAGIVNAASYAGGAVAPGELVTIFQANFGPGTLVGAQLNDSGLVSSNLSGTQVFFDGTAAPLIYALAGVVSAVVPYEVSGKQQTVVQYEYNGVASNNVTVPVAQSAPAIFTVNASGTGPGSVLNSDNTLNTVANPAAGGSYIVVFATGGGTVMDGATDGAIAPTTDLQTLPVTATIGGVTAPVLYAGAAPGEVNGVMQVNLTVPTGLSGAQPLIVTVGNVPSQSGVTVAVK